MPPRKRWSTTKNAKLRRSVLGLSAIELHSDLVQVARTQLEKITAAAHARQKATFNPDLSTNDEPKAVAPSKMKRKVSMGVVVDAETGAVVESGKRQSQRSLTRLNTSMTDLRAKDEMEKKVYSPFCCHSESS